MTSRRQVHPRRVFTPTQRTPPPSHHLLLFEDTNSYQIVARSSMKQLNGDVAFIMIHNKLVKTKAVHHGSLDDCNAEYARLTRISQNEIIEQDDDDLENEKLTIDDSPIEDILYPKPASSNSLLSTGSTPPVLASNRSPRQISDNEEEISTDDEDAAFFDYRKRRSKHVSGVTMKKKKHMNMKTSTNHRSKDLHDQTVDTHDNDNFRLNSKNFNVLETIDNRVNELSQKVISTSSKFDQQMQRLHTKIDRFTSTVNINTHAIESYVDKSGEQFPSELMFDKINLLDVMGSDFGDYARKILRLIFTSDELKNSILPPAKPHLARKPLAEDRFKVFQDAVRFKFKLDLVNFGLFYRQLLRRKLTDFLTEERRRELKQESRQLLKQIRAQRQQNQSNFDETFD